MPVRKPVPVWYLVYLLVIKYYMTDAGKVNIWCTIRRLMRIGMD